MRVLVLSQGKSGSTALETGLRSALNIGFQHALFEPRDLRTIKIPPLAIVKKLIDNWLDEEKELVGLFDRRIFLVRDPRDNLISRFLYMPFGRPEFNDDRNVDRFIDLLRAKISQPNRLDICNLIDAFDEISGLSLISIVGRLMEKTIHVYETLGDKFFLFRYEQLVSGDDRELAEYVGTHLPNQIEVMPQLRRVERSRKSGDWKHWMTEHDKAFFDEFYGRFYKIFGYEPEPLPSGQTLSAKESIEFVVRIVNEGRELFGVAPYLPS
jgi:hypothetical protein